MEKDKHIAQMAEDALNSMDNIQRANPKPYLLTRIQARMDNARPSAWEQVGRFITRPAVAFALCALILLNFTWALISRPDYSSRRTEQLSQSQDDFAYTTVATIYDTENTEP